MAQSPPKHEEPQALRGLLPFFLAGCLLWLAVHLIQPAAPEPILLAADTDPPAPTAYQTLSIASGHRTPIAPRQPPTPAKLLEELLLQAHTAFEARDADTLSTILEDILIDPNNAMAIIDGLATQRWGQGSEPLTPQEDGARLALSAGATLYATDATPTDPSFAEEFLAQAFESLPRMRPRLVLPIAAELARAEVEGVRVIGAEWLPHILRLRWQHPDLRPALDLLLEAVCADEHADGSLLARLFLSDEEDPGLLRIALARLLADDPVHWLGVANEWFEHAPDLATRSALASAVAAAAPPADAARFLADAADPGLFAQVSTLASRPGGLDALADHYEERLLTLDDPGARRALVVGLAREPDLCLGIARTDPDRGVRGQALLSATVRSVSPEALDVLRAAWESGDDPHYGVEPRHLVWAAANTALRAGSDLRPAAVELLRSLAADPALPHAARADACRRLARWLPASEHAALTTGLAASRVTISTPTDPQTQETR